MQLQRLRETQEGILWPQDNDLPIISWQSCESSRSDVPLFQLISVYSPRAVSEAAINTYRRLYSRRLYLHR